jgi:hypothetical protein
MTPRQPKRRRWTMTAAFPRRPTGQTATPHPTCAVRLIDRRTGRGHRINGSPLVLFTRNPTEAVAELLAGRDTRIWEARVEAIGGAA